MTEKHYGGASSFGVKSNQYSKNNKTENIVNKQSKKTREESKVNLSGEYSEYIKAGDIAKKVKEYAKKIVKSGIPLVEIAEKIESKIIELKGKPAFPVNLAINDVAAHYTPSYDDHTLAHGLLKVDFGVQIEGCTADTAFSIDLENSEENKKIIKSAEKALEQAKKIANLGISTNKIGAEIEETIIKEGFQPIRNLSGHSIERYDLHSGITVPNYDNSQTVLLVEGVYAIEPFSTNGFGSVRDGKPSGIYQLQKEGNVRDAFARQVLQYIKEEYKTLPFCSRWIYKKFDSRGLIALKRIEEAGLLYQYPQLIEKGNGKVAQAEDTLIILKEKKIVTTSP